MFSPLRIKKNVHLRLGAILMLLIPLFASNKGFSQYCIPTNEYGCEADYISNFVTTGGISNISNSSGCASSGHANFTGLPGVSQYPGSSVGFTASIGGGWGQGLRVWVDWNIDGDFDDAGELVFSSSTTSSISHSGSFTVPMSATPGATRMRVRNEYAGVPAGPCVLIYYGEAEDYTFTVLSSTPCSGTPTGGTASASPSSSGPSSTFGLSVSDASTTSGLTYQWQQSADGASGWTDISGATGPTYSATAGTLYVTTYYRRKITHL